MVEKEGEKIIDEESILLPEERQRKNPSVVWSYGRPTPRSLGKEGDYYHGTGDEEMNEIAVRTVQNAMEVDRNTVLIAITQREEYDPYATRRVIWVDKRTKEIKKEIVLDDVVDYIRRVKPFPFRDNSVIVTGAYGNGGRIAVVDKSTGKVVWSVKTANEVLGVEPLVHEGPSHTSGDILFVTYNDHMHKFSYPEGDELWKMENVGLGLSGVFELDSFQNFGGDYLVVAEKDAVVKEIKESDKSVQWAYPEDWAHGEGKQGLGYKRLRGPEKAIRYTGSSTRALTLIGSHSRIVGVDKYGHIQFQYGAPSYRHGTGNTPVQFRAMMEISYLQITSRNTLLVTLDQSQVREIRLHPYRHQSPSIKFFEGESFNADQTKTSRTIDTRHTEEPTIIVLDTEDATYDIQGGILDTGGGIEWFPVDTGLGLASYTDPETGNTYYKDFYNLNLKLDYLRLKVTQGGTAGTVDAWIKRKEKLPSL